MSNTTHRHRDRGRATDAEIAAAYGISATQAAQWRQQFGAQVTRAPGGGLAERSPAYPEPAHIHRSGSKRPAQ